MRQPRVTVYTSHKNCIVVESEWTATGIVRRFRYIGSWLWCGFVYRNGGIDV